MASDLFSTVKSYISKVADGEHSPAELANSMNTWIKESTEAIKIKVEEEVERSVSKLGFIKRKEFDELKQELIALKAQLAMAVTSSQAKGSKNSAKKIVKKAAVTVKKKAVARKSAVKKVAKAATKGK